MASSPWVVSDELWELVEPLLPKKERRSRYPGRKRLLIGRRCAGSCSCCTPGAPGRICRRSSGSGRGSRVGVVSMSGSGPACGSRLHALLLTRLRAAGRSSGRARSLTRARSRRKRGSETGPSPVDRGRAGSKHHLLTDAHGIPLAWTLTGGNRNDVTQLLPLLDRVPAVAGVRGRPRRRPDRVVADRGYDHDKYRRLLWARGIKPVIARRKTEHGSGLGRHRWVVERTISLAPPDETTARPLRTPRRDPRSLPRPRGLPGSTTVTTEDGTSRIGMHGRDVLPSCRPRGTIGEWRTTRRRS